MKEPEMEKIAGLMSRVLENSEDEAVLQAVRKETRALCEAFPLYGEYRRS
jgi:glycine/serine hydroxymethyltransferase